MTFENMPPRIAALPRDHRGFPVPWFVAWVDGKPIFARADADKQRRAVREKRCWVCGEPLGSFLAFVIGPMCSVNRISAEPPAHRDCAAFSARVCPFLANPSMKRVPLADSLAGGEGPGVMIKRNPGACCVWVTKGYTLLRESRGVLFRLDDPTSTEWFAEGRAATRGEVLASIGSGLPLLREMAEAQGEDAVRELLLMHDRAMAYVPAAAPVQAPLAGEPVTGGPQ